MEINADKMCFACGKDNPIGLKLEFKELDDKYVAEFTPKPEYQGYIGVLHGGIISTLLDEAMASYLFHKGILAFTAEMNVKFKKPVPTDGKLKIEGWISQQKGRIIEMAAHVLLVDGVVAAQATAKFLCTAGEKAHIASLQTPTKSSK
jgi:uncharacterized protein (TIGR00369 family)